VDQEALETAISDCLHQRIAFDRLGLAQTITLITHDSQWSRYQQNLPLDRDALQRLLDGVRQTRNQLMHFRGDISPVQRNALQYCTQWLAMHQPLPRAYQNEPYVVSVETRDDVETAQHSQRPDEVVPAGEAISPTDSRYAPLADYLRMVSAEHNRIQLGFVDIESIIRDELPPSARSHRAWWANDSVGHVQSREWLDAGWRVASVDLSEEWVVFARIREREYAYIAFFNALLAQLRSVASFPIRSGSPGGASWRLIGGLPESGPHIGFLGFSFARGNRFRVEFYISEGDQLQNKSIFDALHARKSEIEAALGVSANWERLDHRSASRIAIYHEGSITAAAEQLEDLRHWAVPIIIQLHDVIDEALSRRSIPESN
jgi:hypothetical protein